MKEKRGNDIKKHEQRGHNSETHEVYLLVRGIAVVLVVVDIERTLLYVSEVGDDVDESLEKEA